jgi:hypothetical protein
VLRYSEQQAQHIQAEIENVVLERDRMGVLESKESVTVYQVREKQRT